MKWYVLNLNPVPWRVGPVYTGRKKDSHKIGGGVGRDQEVFAYQQAVREELARQGVKPITGKFKLILIFYREMGEYKTPQSRRARNQEADGTNLYKALEDALHKSTVGALEGTLFSDDKDNLNGIWYLANQGPNVVGQVVIGIEEVTEEQIRAEVIGLIPDEVYDQVYGSGHEQLVANLHQTNTKVEPDDYADAPEVF